MTRWCWRQMARAVKAGGRVAVSAFSAYFAVRHLEPGDTFDADDGVNHETGRGAQSRGRSWPRSICGPPASRPGSSG